MAEQTAMFPGAALMVGRRGLSNGDGWADDVVPRHNSDNSGGGGDMFSTTEEEQDDMVPGHDGDSQADGVVPGCDDYVEAVGVVAMLTQRRRRRLGKFW
jgi:hypothetical protein